jgi:hypothetical protein
MKYFITLILSSGLFLNGCVSVERQDRAETETITLQQEEAKKEEFFKEEKGKDVIEAIEYALSLEALIWDRKGQIGERNDVVKIFRKGFCEIKAEEITDYVWVEAVDRSGNKVYMLNPGEPLFTLPNSIEILSEDKMNAKALLRYDEKLQGPVTWAGHTIVATLSRESGVWKICETIVEETDN